MQHNAAPEVPAGNVTSHGYKETDQERDFRAKAGFTDFEKDMPSLGDRFKFSLKDNLSSYLGARNPFSQPVDPQKDYVWLLDNTAYQNRIGRWKAEYVAAYFVKNSGKDLSEIVGWIADKVGLAQDEQAEATIEKRIQPLLDQILPARSVTVDIQGMQVQLGPSGRNGISADEIAIPGSGYKDGEVITSRAVNADATPINTMFVTAKGWAIISDIDDTIKKTLTDSPTGILKTTFVDEPEPIKGMPELYKHLMQKLDHPPIWYLSASPYNLYPFLRTFRSTHYPAGPLLLRDASWMNLAGFLSSLTAGTESYKVDQMAKLRAAFPKRTFLCIGDSSQSDPEAYAEMYRRDPRWVGAIFIRRVRGVSEVEMQGKNETGRFEAAFKGVPREVWCVFDEPRELYERVEALVAGAKKK